MLSFALKDLLQYAMLQAPEIIKILTLESLQRFHRYGVQTPLELTGNSEMEGFLLGVFDRAFPFLQI